MSSPREIIECVVRVRAGDLEKGQTVWLDGDFRTLVTVKFSEPQTLAEKDVNKHAGVTFRDVVYEDGLGGRVKRLWSNTDTLVRRPVSPRSEPEGASGERVTLYRQRGRTNWWHVDNPPVNSPALFEVAEFVRVPSPASGRSVPVDASDESGRPPIKNQNPVSSAPSGEEDGRRELNELNEKGPFRTREEDGQGERMTPTDYLALYGVTERSPGEGVWVVGGGTVLGSMHDAFAWVGSAAHVARDAADGEGEA